MQCFLAASRTNELAGEKAKRDSMESQPECRVEFDLKNVIREASRALALLDTDRLEELAFSCQALNRNPIPQDYAEQARIAREARRDLIVFERVLEVTRANIGVMRILQKSRKGRLEYHPGEG
jgi:hypothetical protein